MGLRGLGFWVAERRPFFFGGRPEASTSLLAVAESLLSFPATSIQCTHTNVPLNLLRSGYTRSGNKHWRSCSCVPSVKRTTRAFLRSGYSVTSDLSGFPVNVKKGMTMRLRYSFAGVVASVALASAAGAADMQPVLKAPAAVDQQATGYVEVYTGWASTRATNFGDSQHASMAGRSAAPVVAIIG